MSEISDLPHLHLWFLLLFSETHDPGRFSGFFGLFVVCSVFVLFKFGAYLMTEKEI